MNESETLINTFSGNILGGELDGISGKRENAREKGSNLMLNTAALLSMSGTNQACVQHWGGIFRFMA